MKQLYLVALLPFAVGCLSVGEWAEHFPDMRRRLDSIESLHAYELTEESSSGVNPPFFGRYPTVTRSYAASGPHDALCSLLAKGFRAEGLAVSHEESDPTRCGFSVRVPSGLRARLIGGPRLYLLRLTVLASHTSADESERLWVSLSDSYDELPHAVFQAPAPDGAWPELGAVPAAQAPHPLGRGERSSRHLA